MLLQLLDGDREGCLFFISQHLDRDFFLGCRARHKNRQLVRVTDLFAVIFDNQISHFHTGSVRRTAFNNLRDQGAFDGGEDRHADPHRDRHLQEMQEELPKGAGDTFQRARSEHTDGYQVQRFCPVVDA